MSRANLERRLGDLADRLRALRAELAVSEEQRAFLEGEASDAELRALVSETPLAVAEGHEARRHASAMGRHLESVQQSIEALVKEQDALLDRLAEELEASP